MNPACADFICMNPPGKWNEKQDEASLQEMSRRAFVLNEGQRMPLIRKVAHSIRILQALMDKGMKTSLSYGGGNDSTILAHLVREEMRWDVPLVYSSTRLDEPCVRIRVKEAKKRWGCHVALPEILPGEAWKKYGVPYFSKNIASKMRQFILSGDDAHLRHIPKSLHQAAIKLRNAGVLVGAECCKHLKKKPLYKWQKKHGITAVITGMRCEESRGRRMGWILRGSLFKSGNRTFCNPLSYWTLSDVKQYMQATGLEYLESRSGCIICPFGPTRSKARNTSVEDAKIWFPKLWKLAMEDWGLGDVISVVGNKEADFDIIEEEP